MSGHFDRLESALSGRYAIERELGTGGMASVYLARDLKHARQVAVKVLRPELAGRLGPDRFLREIEVTANLNHPHILPLLDSGEADGFLFYVMPFAEDESLRDRLRREGQMPIDEALSITREVADALSYAHSRGVIHRDIKPENILLQSGHAVVVDFGIARAITAAASQQLTATGLTVGTVTYMSPEQATGSPHLDGRSDLYSLGCVLYEMLAGQPPFTGPAAEAIVYQHVSVEPRDITVLRPAVPGSVARALMRALAKTPADRFSSVAGFVDALAQGESTPAPATPVVTAPSARRPWRLALAGTLVIASLGAVLLLRRDREAPPSGPAAQQHSEIAVLPFQNLSAEGPYAYFAGGLHDELLTQLTKVAALKVISRTSVMGYSGTSKPLKQIAAELGVGSVVEGSVQVVGERLRVNVQLIDAETDEHLWAERYDRTLDDAFAIQSEVARQIVAAVGVALTSAEKGKLAESPTTNAEAYRLYLQGREYFYRSGYSRENLKIAQRLFERALALDPNFPLAHAALSRVHGFMHWFAYDASPARATRQREEAETALRLAPDLPEAHLTMGLAYYWAQRNYRKALDEFAIALNGRPNDPECLAYTGYVQRRMGNWNEVFAAFESAVVLAPREPHLFYDLGGQSYQAMHRYAEAVRAYDRALILAPDLHDAAIQRGWAYVLWQGQLDTLRVALARLPKRDAVRANLLLLERDDTGLLQEVQRVSVSAFAGQQFFLPTALYAAWAHEIRGDQAAARAAFDLARVRLDSALRELPDDWRLHAARGLALAGLGRRDDALREARWLERSVVYREDAYGVLYVAESRARILAQAGDADAALDEIERLLTGPSWISVHTLRLDPRWDAIREHPRFKELLVKYAEP